MARDRVGISVLERGGNAFEARAARPPGRPIGRWSLGWLCAVGRDSETGMLVPPRTHETDRLCDRQVTLDRCSALRDYGKAIELDGPSPCGAECLEGDDMSA